MAQPAIEESREERPRCVSCGDVIGVYEPLVHVLGVAARRTSRAAEPGVTAAPGKLYHLDCYVRETAAPER